MDDTYTGNTHILQTQLEKYVRQGLYPLHMPGHKRLMQPAPGLPSSWDLTEVAGTDDLHDAGGILSDAMRRTARLWGAERTWYLVNGSTCGLLAAIRSLAGHGAEVICARNCHKAVFHAIELSGYRVRWLMPAVNEEWGICGGISALQVQAALSRYPAAKAVILTSPTYEGILSDIKGICRVCHEKGIPVLVDEAHGAHLMPLSAASGFPAGALAGGADLVVQSPHKTLPSLTQTALLHLQGRLADPARVEEELDIFETSSPSYPLMASLDGCTGILREQGEELFQRWADRIGRFDVTVRSRLHRIRILGHTDLSPACGVCDPGKILIDAGPVGMDGRKMAGILREKYQMETEMTQGGLVLAMTSICDEEKALDRLALALEEIEKSCACGSLSTAVTMGKDPGRNKKRSTATVKKEESKEDKNEIAKQEMIAGTVQNNTYIRKLSGLKPVVFCTIEQAAARESEYVSLDLVTGRICAEYLYFYPPGIPVLAPGEIITKKLTEFLKEADREGAAFYRHAPDIRMIRCLRE